MNTIYRVIIAALVLAFVSYHASVLASESVEETRGRSLKATTRLFFILMGTLMGIGFNFFHPAVYGVVLLAIALMHLTNHEGGKRRASWNWLSIGYSVIFILSTVAYRERHGLGFTPWAFFILIPIVFPFITGAIQSARLDRAGRGEKKAKISKEELTENIVSWAIVAGLAIIVVLLVLNLIRG